MLPPRGSDAATADHLGDHAELWPAPVLSTDVTGLVGALHRAGSAAARFAILSPATLAGVGASDVLRVLEALPAGWQRRSTVQRLLAAGTLDGIDVDAGLVGLVAGAGWASGVNLYAWAIALGVLLTGEAETWQQTVAAVASGGLAGASHVAKATARLAINASPEPASNVMVSLGEDGLVAAVV